MKKYKAIIFDFGGVLLNLKKKKTLNTQIGLSKLFKIDQENTQIIWEKYGKNLLTGKLDPHSFLKIIKNQLNTKKTVKDLYKKWSNLSCKDNSLIDWKLINKIQKLKKEYKIFIHTDTVDVSQNDLITNKMKDIFDDIFTSYQIGYTKENEKSFLAILKKINLKSNEVIFVDDKLKNIKVAKKVGIKSILFTNNNIFIKKLNKYLYN